MVNTLFTALATLTGLFILAWLETGCAKHADFLEMREELHAVAKAQSQAGKQQEALQRRLQALETKRDANTGGKPAPAGEGGKEAVGEGQRLEELTARLADLERRLAYLEDTQHAGLSKPDSTSREPSRQSKPARLPDSPRPGLVMPGTPAITPTSAFNLAYNDYLDGRFELAVTGFQRFLKDFPTASLVPSAYYWLGESYYSMRDFVHAMQAFERVVDEYPRSDKVAPALFKLGLAAAEVGDTQRARGLLKRVIEEFSHSDEAKLAKNKLTEIR